MPHNSTSHKTVDISKSWDFLKTHCDTTASSCSCLQGEQECADQSKSICKGEEENIVWFRFYKSSAGFGKFNDNAV